MKKTEIEALPTKGKPEEFFEHKGLDFEPNEEQMILWRRTILSTQVDLI